MLLESHRRPVGSGVTIDPAALADGVHAITATAHASASPNQAIVSRPFVARRPRFGDVGPSYWAYLPVELQSQRGILNGNGTGEFQPDRPISRQEAATIIPRSVPLTATPPRTFADQDEVQEWALPGVQAANGITTACMSFE